MRIVNGDFNLAFPVRGNVDKPKMATVDKIDECEVLCWSFGFDSVSMRISVQVNRIKSQSEKSEEEKGKDGKIEEEL